MDFSWTKTWAKWWIKGLIVLVVLLIAARIALPYLVKHIINEELAGIEGYWGHVDDVDIHLWRGAYGLVDIKVLKKNGKIRTPFFKAKELEFSLEWEALFDGRIVAEGDLWEPQLNFVNGPTDATSQSGAEGDWRETMDNIVPLDINRFSIYGGAVHFRDFHAKPKVNVFMKRINGTVRNLRNTKAKDSALPSTFEVSGIAMGSGRMRTHGKVNILAKQPHLVIDFNLRKLELKGINDFLVAYGGVDAEAGTASLYASIEIENGRIKGFAKPLFEDVTLFRFNEDGDFLDKLGDFLAEAGFFLLKNHKYDRLATKIPIDGKVDAPDVDVWATIFGILRNEFIKAFMHGLGKTSLVKTGGVKQD